MTNPTAESARFILVRAAFNNGVITERFPTEDAALDRAKALWNNWALFEESSELVERATGGFGFSLPQVRSAAVAFNAPADKSMQPSSASGEGSRAGLESEMAEAPPALLPLSELLSATELAAAEAALADAVATAGADRPGLPLADSAVAELSSTATACTPPPARVPSAAEGTHGLLAGFWSSAFGQRSNWSLKGGGVAVQPPGPSTATSAVAATPTPPRPDLSVGTRPSVGSPAHRRSRSQPTTELGIELRSVAIGAAAGTGETDAAETAAAESKEEPPQARASAPSLGGHSVDDAAEKVDSSAGRAGAGGHAAIAPVHRFSSGRKAALAALAAWRAGAPHPQSLPYPRGPPRS